MSANEQSGYGSTGGGETGQRQAETKREAELLDLDKGLQAQLLQVSLRFNEGVPIQLDPGSWTLIWPQFNAELPQRATAFMPEDGNWQQWPGQGENNNAARPWRVRGYREVVISVEHERDGTWRESLLKVRRNPRPSPDLTIRVMAEDSPGGGADWNDTIVFIVPQRE